METEQLIKIIDEAAARTGYSPRTLCLYAGASPLLYDRLMDGGECLPSTSKKVLAWIEANKDIDRDPRGRKPA